MAGGSSGARGREGERAAEEPRERMEKSRSLEQEGVQIRRATGSEGNLGLSLPGGTVTGRS